LILTWDWAMHLNGKSAIVTGGTRGIGKTIAELLASQGVSVAIADVDQDAAQSVATAIESAGGRAMGLAMDVTNEVAVNRATDRVACAFGGVDILVSNAGVQLANPIESFAFADWRKVLAIQVEGAFVATKAALKYMYPNNRGGTVIYMGPFHSQEAAPLKSAYAAVKLGLLGLARVLAKEGAAHNVRSHVIVSTPLLPERIPGRTRDFSIGPEEVVRGVKLGSSVDGIFTTVEETVLFLCECPSAALTGHSFVVSHGWLTQEAPTQ
jgi:3-hydroxybutyrate dehydrogenase